jgi:hypothetical protein
VKPKTRPQTPPIVRDTRESRGPETSHYLEDDTSNTSKEKKGISRSQDKRVRGELDDDVVR